MVRLGGGVVLWVLVGPLNMQRELCTCCYLLHHLLGPQCLLVKALRYQVVEVVNKGFSSVAMQISTSHCCIAYEYDVSFIIGTYLNVCMKAPETDSLSDPGGQIMTSFQYLGEKNQSWAVRGKPATSLSQEPPLLQIWYDLYSLFCVSCIPIYPDEKVLHLHTLHYSLHYNRI